MYEEFRTGAKADARIIINDEDIDLSHAMQYNLKTIQVKPQNVLSKTTEALLEFDVLLMHGAVIAVNDKAYLFAAPSGTGKTTHILKWMEYLPDAFVVNGDKPFIKLGDGVDKSPLACGSPWAGKENMYTNNMVPLKAIILMERAEDNRIDRISFADAFPGLLQQTHRPKDTNKMRKTLKLLQQLHPAVKFYQFKCNNYKNDCFDIAYNALVRREIDS